MDRPAQCALLALGAIGLWLSATPPAAAGESKADIRAKAQAMLAATDLRCNLVDADKAEAEETRGGSGRHGGHSGGGMGGAGGSPRGEARPVAYEVACQEGVGFILLNPPSPRGRDKAEAPPPQYLNCLEAREAADQRRLPYQCRLKANRDPIAGVQAIAAHAGLDCAVSGARGLGHTEDKSFIEIVCAKPGGQPAKGQSRIGWVLVTQRAIFGDQSASALSCFDTEPNPGLRCRLTNASGPIDALRRFVARSEPGCAPVKQRLVGVSASGGEVFEVACRNGEAYMAHRTGDGALDSVISCADAAIVGRCRLVDPSPKS